MIDLEIFSQDQLSDILLAACSCDRRLALDQNANIYDLQGWVTNLAFSLRQMLQALDENWTVSAAPVLRRRALWNGFLLLDNGASTTRLSLRIDPAVAVVGDISTALAARQGRRRVVAQVTGWISKQALPA